MCASLGSIGATGISDRRQILSGWIPRSLPVQLALAVTRSVAVATALLLSLSRPASAIDTVWLFNGDGNWTEAVKWSNGEPTTSAHNVFIDDGDTAVTVTLNASRTIGGLTLGADDAVLIQTTGSSTLTLTSANGFTNDGSILLTGTSSGAAALAVTTGTLTNSATGLLHFQTGGTGGRTFTGDLTNNGTVLIDKATTFNKSSGVYSNNSQFAIGNTLTISNGGTFQQAAGTLSVDGSLTLSGTSALNLNDGMLDLNGTISMNSGTTFTQNGGTLSYNSGTISGGAFSYLGGTVTGTPQLSLATLAIGPAATNPASFLLLNDNTLSGDVHAGQTLTVQNTFTVAHTLTSATGFTNDGSILLIGTSTGGAVLAVTSGTLTNSATGLLHFQSGVSGGRTFTGDLTNNGAVLVNFSTTFNKSGGMYTNNGQFTIGSTLTVSNGGTFQQAAGTLNVNGSLTLSGTSALNLNGGTLALDGSLSLSSNAVTQNSGTLAYTSGTISNGTFNYLGGTITGTPQLSGATLAIGPAATNPASFLLLSDNTLSGDVHAGQTLTVQNMFTTTRTLTSAAGFTNDGSILLTATDTGVAALAVTTGTLTISATGLLHFQSSFTGGRTFTGDLTNNGTVLINRGTFNKSNGLYSNNGQFTIGNTLTISNGGTFQQAAGTLSVDGSLTLSGMSALNLNGGTLALDGSLSLSSNAFTQNGGTLAYTSGAISNGTYNYLGGTITGTPQLSSATLAIGPAATNPASILLLNDNTLSGDVHAGQTLTVQNTLTTTHTLTSATSFINDGSILITTTNSGAAALAVTTGTLTNSATGLLHFQSSITGSRTFTGDLTNNGTVLVDRATTFNKSGGMYTNNGQFTINSSLTISSGTLTNVSANVLTGGTYDVTGTFRFPNADVSINQAQIILRGASSQIQNSSSADGLANLGAIGSMGALRLFSGRNFTTAVAFTNDGELQLGGTSFTAPSLANNASGQIFGSGTLASTVNNAGTISATGGTLNVAAPLTSVNGATLSGNGTTNINAGFSLAGTTTKQDSGTVTIKGPQNLSSGSALVINGGTVKFNVTSGAVTVGTGVSVAVNSGASLELAGTVSALASGSNRVDIQNSSSATAGIIVSGKNQIVGGIDGSGSTQINAGSDLAANHIIQSALVIGGAAGSRALVTIAASDASGNPLGAARGGPFDQTAADSSGLNSSGSVASISEGTEGFLDADGMSASNRGEPGSALIPANLNGDVSAVPEPAALLLAAMGGFAVLVVAARKRRRCAG